MEIRRRAAPGRPPLTVAWWTLLILRGLLPALFAIAMGRLVQAVQQGGDLAAPLGLVGTVFVLLQVLSPIHQAVGANLGSRTAAWLYDQLTTACVRPPGMGHLENPKLTTDLTMARDFDLGITGPPMSISMDFIAGGLVEMIGGLASAVVLAGYAWWAPLLLAGAWLATHWLLKESAVWRDRNTDEVRAGAAPCRLCATGSQSNRRRPKSCGSSGWRLDCRRLPVAATPSVRTSLASHASARAPGDLEPAAGPGRQYHCVLVSGC